MAKLPRVLCNHWERGLRGIRQLLLLIYRFIYMATADRIPMRNGSKEHGANGPHRNVFFPIVPMLSTGVFIIIHDDNDDDEIQVRYNTANQYYTVWINPFTRHSKEGR